MSEDNYMDVDFDEEDTFLVEESEVEDNEDNDDMPPFINYQPSQDDRRYLVSDCQSDEDMYSDTTSGDSLSYQYLPTPPGSFSPVAPNPSPPSSLSDIAQGHHHQLMNPNSQASATTPRYCVGRPAISRGKRISFEGYLSNSEDSFGDSNGESGGDSSGDSDGDSEYDKSTSQVEESREQDYIASSNDPCNQLSPDGSLIEGVDESKWISESGVDEMETMAESSCGSMEISEAYDSAEEFEELEQEEKQLETVLGQLIPGMNEMLVKCAFNMPNPAVYKLPTPVMDFLLADDERTTFFDYCKPTVDQIKMSEDRKVHIHSGGDNEDVLHFQDLNEGELNQYICTRKEVEKKKQIFKKDKIVKSTF